MEPREVDSGRRKVVKDSCYLDVEALRMMPGFEV